MSKYKEYALGDILQRADRFEERIDENDYTFAGVYSYCKGIFVRPPVKGTTFKLPKIQRIHQGDFVYSKIMAWEGAFSVVQEEAHNTVLSGAFVAYIADNKIVLTKYLDYYFKIKSIWKSVGSKSTGTNMRRRTLHPKEFEKHIIRLPAVEEQARLVSILDKIFEAIRILRTEVDNSLEQSKAIKESVLQQAVQGKLTVQWRSENPSIEDASELLKRIEAEKEQLIADKKIKKEKPLPPLENKDKAYKLPESWTWCRLGQISEKLGAGSTPSGGKTAYIEEGIMFFRSQNIHNHYLKLQEVAYIPEATHEKMRGTKVRPKDLLLNITGGSIGRCALIQDDFETANVSQHVAIVRMTELETRRYIHQFIISPDFQDRIMDVQVGVSREGLSMTKLKLFPTPLPPLEEQHAIVNKVNSLMELCDELEHEVNNSQAQIEQLMQSCLKEVFEEA